jgi:hypothetical protein
VFLWLWFTNDFVGGVLMTQSVDMMEALQRIGYKDDAVDAETKKNQGKARDFFYAYRKVMHPQMLTNWWTEEISWRLQFFFEDLMEGKRPKLALEAPPQHGKSAAVQDFIAWVAGRNPDLKTIFCSYSDELGARANIELQRALTSPTFKGTFGRTQIEDVEGQWVRNQSLIEYPDYAGSFRNTTIAGGVTGFALDLGIIDDYVKDRNEASSPTQRAKTWSWFTDVFMPRFSALSGLLIVCTRWHVDDLLGRYLLRNPDVEVLRYPAIAEKDEFWDIPQYQRAKGEALFPSSSRSICCWSARGR